jgi:two-component system response regulator DesR
VRNHISAILAKLAVETRQQAVLLAQERGWI